ncbi:hypothetical protein [[Mycobacterium] crassicus]|uniref:Uncharacterized protein n=1 Tax=[Mycobacterium] crassicus TaxID=2872309 RepID=A0ABU5XPN7_9MYCO|nr:hypothetical protein [Mycolicibacter sp. MYC098]MEB3024154.1 hypothetical protein [Mycolicibacter sp. MYC098]
MTTALDYEIVDPPGLAQLEERLKFGRRRSIAVINAPLHSPLRLLSVSRANPYESDVVIAFATRRVDLAWLKPAYRAAYSRRTSWLIYPEPTRPGTDLRWDWFLAALRQYGVHVVQQVSLDRNWSAVQLMSKQADDQEADLVGYPADPAVESAPAQPATITTLFG